MTATTIEQSKHLLDLGLDPKTADCNWNTTFGDLSLCIGKNKLPHAVPAWTLSALLEVMKEHCPELLFLEAYWYCRCMQAESEYCDDPIIAVYDVVCWLLDHNAIKNVHEHE